jgi:hypothetical protein
VWSPFAFEIALVGINRLCSFSLLPTLCILWGPQGESCIAHLPSIKDDFKDCFTLRYSMVFVSFLVACTFNVRPVDEVINIWVTWSWHKFHWETFPVLKFVSLYGLNFLQQKPVNQALLSKSWLTLNNCLRWRDRNEWVVELTDDFGRLYCYSVSVMFIYHIVSLSLI